jgi:hypothetical protein
MNILKQKWIFLNKTKANVSPQISKLYQFGLETLACRSIMSLRANARLLPLNWNTAKSKIYRLLSNGKIPLVFITLLQTLSLVGEKDIVNIDFSDFGNGFQVLMFAKQTSIQSKKDLRIFLLSKLSGTSLVLLDLNQN